MKRFKIKFINKVSAKPAILILADISGYTNFLMSNNLKDEWHSELVIGELLESIIEEAKIPIKVYKQEGDAIFLYAVKQKSQAAWARQQQEIGQRMFDFFERFADKLVELSGSKLCYGNRCQNLNKLKLKVVIHSGEVLFHKISDFEELSGVDVIIAHRLLKNSVSYDHYILVTEAAKHDIRLPDTWTVKTHQEKYSDVGKVKTQVYLPPEHTVCPVET